MIRGELQAPAVKEEAFTQPAEHPLFPCDTCQIKCLHKVPLTNSSVCHHVDKRQAGDEKQEIVLLFILGQALFFVSVCGCV